MLDYLTPPPAEPAGKKPKKLSSKEKKAEEAAQQAARAARQEWLGQVNAQITRLSQPPRRGNAGAAQNASADVRLAAFRPIKVLADALVQK
jgi:hypothetical protein